MSKRDTVDAALTNIVAEMAGMSSSQIAPDKWLNEYGIDSLSLLIVRERIERRFGVHMTDVVWTGFSSIKDLISYVHESNVSHEFNVSASVPAEVEDREKRSRRDPIRALSGKTLIDEIEIGMPHTGRNNLAEGPLLQYLGNLRWKHISELCNVPSSEIVDDEGDRLYATFFYVEVAFPEERPMGTYGENDRFKVKCTLEGFGEAMLDGVAYLLPSDSQGATENYKGVDDAAKAGIPAVRLSNIFVKQFSGAEWLKRAKPANKGFSRIPQSAVPPDSYARIKQAQNEGAFSQAGASYVRLNEKPIETEYKLVPDRDLNGAGLVYFANYPVILDICERTALSSCRWVIPEKLVDKRTLVRRKSAYLNNASSNDTVIVETDIWIRNPVLDAHPAPEICPINLWINARMIRKSDGRIMMIATTEKTIIGSMLEDLPFFELLLAEKNEDATSQ